MPRNVNLESRVPIFGKTFLILGKSKEPAIIVKNRPVRRPQDSDLGLCHNVLLSTFSAGANVKDRDRDNYPQHNVHEQGFVAEKEGRRVSSLFFLMNEVEVSEDTV